MLKVFPTHLFCFENHAPDIEYREITGGESISGLIDVIQADGGGRVVCPFDQAFLDDPKVGRSWSAIAARREPMIVPLCDTFNQGMGDITLPAGGLPWWMEDDFTTSDAAMLAADANLRATTITVDIDGLPADPEPGMWFSIDHTNRRHRAYRITNVVGDAISFLPPLREATEAGTPLEFVDPKCMMRIEGVMPSSNTLGYRDPASVRWVEDFHPSYDPFSDDLTPNSLLVASVITYIDGEPVVMA